MHTIVDQSKQRQDIIVGGGQFKDISTTGENQFAFSILNLTTRQHQLIPLTFLVHGIALNPKHPEQMIVCEKIGPGAAMIDVDTRQVLETISTDSKRLFYGHCAFAKDGHYFYTTETYRDSFKGVVVIRDIETLKAIGEFPTYGQSPHECFLIDNGQTMVVTNGGGNIQGDKPNVSYIDIASQQLIRQEHVTNRHINAGHLALSEEGHLIVVSAPRAGLNEDKLGGISIQPAGKTMRSVTSPKKVVSNMKGEALSVAVYKDVALVTHPNGNMITFWSMKDRRLLNKIDLPGPRGVTLTRNEHYFVVSFSNNASVLLVDTKSLEIVPGSTIHATYLTGSHLFNWSQLAECA